MIVHTMLRKQPPATVEVNEHGHGQYMPQFDSHSSAPRPVNPPPPPPPNTSLQSQSPYGRIRGFAYRSPSNASWYSDPSNESSVIYTDSSGTGVESNDKHLFTCHPFTALAGTNIYSSALFPIERFNQRYHSIASGAGVPGAGGACGSGGLIGGGPDGEGSSGGVQVLSVDEVLEVAEAEEEQQGHDFLYAKSCL